MQPAHRTLFFGGCNFIKKGANVFQMFKCSKQTVKSDKFPAKECACKWPSLGSQRGPQRCLRGLQGRLKRFFTHQTWHFCFSTKDRNSLKWCFLFVACFGSIHIHMFKIKSQYQKPFLPMQLPPPQWGEVPHCGGAQRSSVSGPSRSGARSVCRSKVHLENPFGEKNDDDDTKIEPFQTWRIKAKLVGLRLNGVECSLRMLGDLKIDGVFVDLLKVRSSRFLLLWLLIWQIWAISHGCSNGWSWHKECWSTRSIQSKQKPPGLIEKLCSWILVVCPHYFYSRRNIRVSWCFWISEKHQEIFFLPGNLWDVIFLNN